jgi:hypothetical protein
MIMADWRGQRRIFDVGVPGGDTRLLAEYRRTYLGKWMPQID